MPTRRRMNTSRRSRWTRPTCDLAVKVSWQYLAQGDTPGGGQPAEGDDQGGPQTVAALSRAGLHRVQQPQQARPTRRSTPCRPSTSNRRTSSATPTCARSTRRSARKARCPALLDRAAKADSKDAFFWLQLGALYAEVYLAEDAGKERRTRSRRPPRSSRRRFPSAATTWTSSRRSPISSWPRSSWPRPPRSTSAWWTSIPARNAARDNLARCYLGLKQPDKAATALEDSIKQNPVQPHAYEVLAEIYEDAGQEEKAIQNYEQSLLLNPKDIRGYQDLGVVCS